MKATFRTFTLLLIILLSGVAASAQDRSAAALLQRCTAALEKSGAVQMDFTIRGQGGDFAGKITMSGNSFAMVVPGVRIWFDGRTQWTLLEEQNSVSITEPTLDELMESNPFVILSNYASRYKARRTDGAPAGCKRVVLTPTGSSAAGILTATLTLSDASGLPTELDLMFDNGAQIKATVSASRSIPRPKASAFRFNPKDFQTIETVDLR